MSANSQAVVVVDANVSTMAPAATPGPAEGEAYGLIRDGAVVLDGGSVAWVGARADLPSEWAGAETRSVGGRLVTPGLVECHSHLLFAGDRRDEFAARAQGRSDEELAEEGGIHATVAATRAASDEELLAATLRRARWFIRQGVTTLEIKTGYGIEPQEELRLLSLAATLRERLPIRVRITLQAGHTYPRGGDPEEYVMAVCDELLPAAMGQGIMDAVEVYCEETIGISMEDASTILETAYRKKIPTRVAADHLSDSAGGALAPAFYSKAAMHLVHTDEVAVKAMGRAGTTAVLLPGVTMESGASERPPIPLLRENGVPLAVSTGCNPGTSPLADLRFAAHLAGVLYGLSLPEALHGITSVAARALGLEDGTGTLAEGVPADLAVWDAEHPTELAYWAGAPLCHQVWSAGRLVDPEGDAG